MKKNKSKLTQSPSLKIGDTFTLANQYRTRTFWQWLTNKPRKLQIYKITAETTSGHLAYSEHGLEQLPNELMRKITKRKPQRKQ